MATRKKTPSRSNPKKHDALFKWLIASFTLDFFAHYFPSLLIGKYAFIDKEFIQKYEALRESLEDDLFLVMEVEIDGVLQEVVIQIEHKSRREDVTERMYEYQCYAWLLKKKPVWSIIIYTDEARWRKPVADRFWYGFSNSSGPQYCQFDVIKVKAEKSAELIQKHSLMCKLLALKADDQGMDRAAMIREIYQTMAAMEGQLSNDQKLLVEQWIQAYRKLPVKVVKQIREEVQMGFVATTITEHYINQGKIEGRTEGKIEGKTEGKIEGKIENLEELHKSGIISFDQMQRLIAPLKRQLEELQAKFPPPAAGSSSGGISTGAAA